MVEIRKELNDLAQRLGATADAIQNQVATLGSSPLAALKQLGLVYGAEGLEGNKFAQRVSDSRAEIAPPLHNPRPQDRLAVLNQFLRETYFVRRPEAHASSEDPFVGLLTRRRSEGAKLGRLVQNNESVRAAVGRKVGGEVLADGRTDGVISVSTSAMTAAGSNEASFSNFPPSQNIYDLFVAMDQAILMEAAKLGKLQTGGARTPGARVMGGKGSLEGMIGQGTSVSGLLGDSPEATADELDASGSIDVGTLNLKRMIDKRDQMMNAVKNVFEKWNMAAKTAIDNAKA